MEFVRILSRRVTHENVMPQFQSFGKGLVLRGQISSKTIFSHLLTPYPEPHFSLAVPVFFLYNRFVLKRSPVVLTAPTAVSTAPGGGDTSRAC